MFSKCNEESVSQHYSYFTIAFNGGNVAIEQVSSFLKKFTVDNMIQNQIWYRIAFEIKALNFIALAITSL